MATVATRLRNFLKAQSTVTTYTGDRIAETRQPQNKPDPFIVLRRVSRENADALDDSAGNPPMFDGIQIDCVSRVEATANAVGDAVRTVLHLYRGTFDDTTAKGCFVDSETLDFQNFGDGSDDGLFVRTLDTRIFL